MRALPVIRLVDSRAVLYLESSGEKVGAEWVDAMSVSSLFLCTALSYLSRSLYISNSNTQMAAYR